jgi:hypothetical protein
MRERGHTGNCVLSSQGVVWVSKKILNEGGGLSRVPAAILHA